MRYRIYGTLLLVGMADSIHVARWLEGNLKRFSRVILISSSPHRRVHPDIRVILKADKTLHMPAVSRYLGLPLWILDRPFLFGNRLRAGLLVQQIRKYAPSLVHLMETQNAGYMFARARDISPEIARVRTVLTLFGSDLFWFSKFKFHEKWIKRVLSDVDFLFCESSRDVEIAKNLGYRGIFLPPNPVAPGLALSNKALTPPEKRRVILVKGYDNRLNWGSRALDAIAQCDIDLTGYKLVVFSAEGLVVRRARKLNGFSGLEVEVYRKHALSHSDMLALFEGARVYVGISRSDGLPSSVLEAMSRGAFPIQSNTSTASEWFEDGISGFAVDPYKIEDISFAISRAILADDLVRDASFRNIEVIKTRFNINSMSEQTRINWDLITRE